MDPASRNDGLNHPTCRPLAWAITIGSTGLALLIVLTVWFALRWSGNATAPPPGITGLLIGFAAILNVSASHLLSYYLRTRAVAGDHHILLTHMEQVSSRQREMETTVTDLADVVRDLAEACRSNGAADRGLTDATRELVERVQAWDDGYRVGAADALAVGQQTKTNGTVVTFPFQTRGH